MNPHTPDPESSRNAAVYDSEKRLPEALDELVELRRFFDLVVQWTQRNIKLRYKRSALGILWTLLEPLLLLTILTIVFSKAFRFPMHNFSVYLLPGLILFDFFRRSTLQIMDETVASQHLAQRIRVPRTAFAVAAVATHLVNLLMALIPLFLIMLVFHHTFSWALLLIFPGILLLALFALGFGLAAATLAAFFPDFVHTFQVLLTAWFYATPIFYPMDIVPPDLQPYFLANPLLHLFQLIRLPVYHAQAPTGQQWSIGIVVSVSTLVLGWLIFTRHRNAFAYQN